MSVVAPMMKENDNAWASRYLLDPLNPVEAWQTAQIGGQYSDVIPTQHSLKSRSSNTSSMIGRSKTVHIPKTNAQIQDRSSRVLQENINPSLPKDTMKDSSSSSPAPRARMVRHHSDEQPKYVAAERRSSQHSRSPRSRRPRQMQGVPADIIDSLDMTFGGPYHHEGPFDATLAARNRHSWKSPVEATKIGNQMALDATAPADIQNALEMHRPLEGVAVFEPGTVSGGKRLSYEEYDLQRKEGNFRRWDGFSYLDEDLKGKGTLGYEGDKKEKAQKAADHRRAKSESHNSFELEDRSSANRTPSPNVAITTSTDLKRGGSTAGRLEGAAARIKRRFSLSRRSKGSP